MKTAKTQTASNSALVSGPKYCDGEQTTAEPSSPDSIRARLSLQRKMDGIK